MPDDSAADEPFASIHRHRIQRIAAIKAGALPDTVELLSSLPFMCESAELDYQAYYDEWEEEAGDLDLLAPPKLFAALDKATLALKRIFSLDKLRAAIRAAEAVKAVDLTRRLYIYAACAGDPSARVRVAAMALHEARALHADAGFFIYFALGMATSSKAPTPDMALAAGRNALSSIAKDQAEFDRLSAIDDADDVHFSFDEDRSEFFASGNTTVELLQAKIAGKRAAAVPSIVVVPPMAAPAQAHRRESLALVMPIVGRPLPLVAKPDLQALQRAMDEEFPWASSVTSTILRDLQGGAGVYIQPTLLISDPGAGKTSYARRLLECTGLVTEMLPLGGAADSSLLGTSIQYSSARPSDALRLIARARQASVGIVIDEVEKTADSHNGSAAAALLSFLERSTARRLRDPALEIEVDLSWISWIATANDVAKVPAPLRDRMRVLRMPAPGMEHIGSISRRILDEIATARGEDPRFIPDLEPDEIESIEPFWTDGSLRRLRRILEIVVEGRERMAMGRC